jgi:Tol biopolymer transport system component
VAFYSDATNLVPNDTNGWTDVFVHDRKTGQTERVNLGPGGAQADDNGYQPAISRHGRYVAFSSSATNLLPGGDRGAESAIYVRDRLSKTTELVSAGLGGGVPNGGSGDPSISGDGRYVAFDSAARNLVPGDDNGALDVFVRDRLARRTERVSVTTAGRQANGDSFAVTISADSRVVAFGSGATDLVAHDTNGVNDVFVHEH